MIKSYKKHGKDADINIKKSAKAIYNIRSQTVLYTLYNIYNIDESGLSFNESGNGLTNQRGTVGLARGPEPHSGDCQFYVNVNDNSALDPTQARWGYAVFGKVVDGMDVVDRISTVATGAKGPFKDDSPLQQVIIEKIERVAAP